jgi:flagellar motor switch protein FliG
MAEAPSVDIVAMLLRLMPAEVAEAIMSRLGEAEAARLRARLAEPSAAPPPGAEIDAALAQFFDLQRILERPPPAASTTPPPPPAPPEPPEPPPPPADTLRTLTPDILARALDGEQPGTVAIVLGTLDPSVAGKVLQRMPLEFRAEVTLRMAKPTSRSPQMIDQLLHAVADKARRLTKLPKEPNPDELIEKLADMIRALPRAERLPVIKQIEAADPVLATKILEKLYRIEDLLRIPDRQMQVLLGKLDVKTLATALKGVTAEIMDKVTRNMSSRSRDVLRDESELLGTVPASRIREAQAKVIAAVRKAEEDGEVTPED